MTKSQDLKLMMYYSVISVNEKYQTTWSGNSIYSDSHNKFKVKVQLIESTRELQIAESMGITVDKKVKKDALIDKVVFIEHRIKSFASNTGNAELLTGMDYTASRLKHVEQAELAGIANIIIGKAQANIAALAPYGITAAVITDIQSAVTAYNTALPRTKAAKIQKRNATLLLKQYFEEADTLLKERMDMDIDIFKVSKPDFYTQYKLARIIGGGSHGTIMLKVNVTQKPDGLPLHNVLCTLANTNSKQAPVIKKTSTLGHFSLKNLSEGVYEVKFSKIGFKEQVISTNIVDGEMTTLDIVMEPL